MLNWISIPVAAKGFTADTALGKLQGVAAAVAAELGLTFGKSIPSLAVVVTGVVPE